MKIIDVDLKIQPKQLHVFATKANEILFGGAAGGGKSHLLRLIAIFFAVKIPNIQIYLFRRMVTDLERNHVYGVGSLTDMLSTFMDNNLVRYQSQRKIFTFKNGSNIHLCHVKNDASVQRFQGPEIHILLMDELTHFTEYQYRFLRSRSRLGGLVIPEEFKDKLPLIVNASNPGSVGHNWVKKTFVSCAPAGEYYKAPEDEGGRLRIFIRSLLEDNLILKYNDPDYESRLMGLGNPELVKAMRWGDWDIVAGGALDDVWSSKCIIKPFNIPPQWRVDRSFDWGSSHPFSVGWWALSDGTEITYPDGSVFCPPPKTLIRIGEWYGCHEKRSNEGVRLSPSSIAEGILYREKVLKNTIVSGQIFPGPADNQIRDVRENDVPTIEKRMASSGIRWTESDKSPGSRIVGLSLLRERLAETKKDTPENPAIYFFNTCLKSIELLPTLPRDENNIEDVDTDSEDHIYDEVRYRVLAATPMARKINLKMST